MPSYINLTISGVNAIGIYNYIDSNYVDNLSNWNEPSFYDKLYKKKKLNIVNTSLNDGVVTILNDNIEKEIPVFFFEKNIKLFKYNGGDMENLWHLTKICHSRRIFGKPVELLKKINSEDLESALKLYCDNDFFNSDF